MKENKFTIALKAAAFSLLGILLLTLIYIAANHFFFAAATEGEIVLDTNDPPAVPLSRSEVVPEGFPFPEFSLHIINPPDEILNPNALTGEEAAEIGAKYIWEMFGVDISDTNMYVGIESFPTSTRVHWGGTIGIYGALYPAPDYYIKWLFSFTIDSITGERIEIQDFRSDEIDVSGETISGGNHEQLVETFTEIALDYAERHFNFSEVESISYEGMRNLADHREYFESEDGYQHFRIVGGDICCHLWNGETLLNFTAIDSTGRSANLAISMETQRLAFLTTRHNDIIPGWEAAPHGGRYAMTQYGPWISLYLGPQQRITAVQSLEGVDSHIFYEENIPTLTLSYPQDQHYISMDFTGELIPLNVNIIRRRVDQIGHNYSIDFITLEASDGWTPGTYEYMISITDDGFDYFYFMRATWPEGHVTNIFRVNSGNPREPEVILDPPNQEGESAATDQNATPNPVWLIQPTLTHDHIINCSCGQFVINDWMHSLDPTTGQVSGYHGGHGGHGPNLVFDRERQLFGHPGYGTGYFDMFGMHPLDEVRENLNQWVNPLDRSIFVESVDSSRREYYESQILNELNEVVTYTFWWLTPAAFLGHFALMSNGQFITDFIFDGVSIQYANWQEVHDSGMVAVSQNGEWGLVDRNGSILMPFMFQNLVIIDQNTAFARYEGRYGIINIPQTIAALGGA